MIYQDRVRLLIVHSYVARFSGNSTISGGNESRKPKGPGLEASDAPAEGGVLSRRQIRSEPMTSRGEGGAYANQ